MKFGRIYRKYAALTMIPEKTYLDNLELARRVANVDGSIVECGVWRGGMMAGIADVLGADRSYYLYDSFEGLPAPTAIDGERATTYQESTDDPLYYDNCRASEDDARAAMARSAATQYRLLKGWFDQTLPNSPPAEPIALLRLDGDWYESNEVRARASSAAREAGRHRRCRRLLLLGGLYARRQRVRSQP